MFSIKYLINYNYYITHVTPSYYVPIFIFYFIFLLLITIAINILYY